VAALVAIVGVLIARGLFEVPLLAPTGEGALGDATAGLNAAIGITIGSLVSSVGRSALR
jgi:hypothetical protein